MTTPADNAAPEFQPCRTTRHCADHGWCRRCDPEFANVMARVNKAVQDTDPESRHWGRLYEAIAAELRQAPATVARQVLGTPTTDPAPETDEQRADREETEREHAAGIHTHCGLTCEVDLPTEHLRNFVIAKGYPGTKGALDELLRRAAAPAPAAPADRVAMLRWAADLADQRASSIDAFSSSDYGEEARAVRELASVAAEFRRLADEAQPTAPWPSTTEYAVEIWEADEWVGISFQRPTLAEVQERRDAARRRFPDARFRIVRWDETATIAETDPEPKELRDPHPTEADLAHALNLLNQLPATAATEDDDTLHTCPGRWGGPDCRCFDPEPATAATEEPQP